LRRRPDRDEHAGKGFLEHLVLGSTTTKVLQLATVPVTLVK
jgi:nucleotide-binding universal stress UspA family protein